MNPDQGYQQTTAPRPAANKLLVAAISLLAVALVAVGIFAASRSRASTCITPQDYLAFYGEAPFESQFEPTVSFFHKEYGFLPDSATIDTGESDSLSIDATNLARFYSDRTGKPMSFTVAAVYEKDSTAGKTIAEQRAKVVTDALIKAGIPTDLIKPAITSYTTADDSELPDASDSVSLTLAASESCTE